MEQRSNLGALAFVTLAGLCLAPAVQAQDIPSPLSAPLSGEQQEADLRVIAARCGSPAFEKAFFKQSKAVVAAGIVSKSRHPVDVEKSVSTLRRSPFVLVAAPSDCPAQMAMLKELQKSRGDVLKKARGRK
ncbi:MAG: hypothetical protein WKG52_10710 [Variovorax sp.]